MSKQGPPPPGFMPPPPYHEGVPPQQPRQGGPSVIIMHQTQLGPDPQTMTCPHCQATVTTVVETSPNTKTHIIALLLCVFGCCPCAACVYCADSCLAKNHTCPNCHKFIGVYEN